MFSYKPQVDDIPEAAEEVGETSTSQRHQLPHQLSCSSLKTDGDFIYQKHQNATTTTALYESTQFATNSAFSPDSFSSNYSINNSLNK